MAIELTREDQILVLQRARNVQDWVKYMGQVNFDSDLRIYPIELSNIENIIKDSCVLSLKSDNETKEDIKNAEEECDYRSYQTSIYNENRL